jgi:phosphoenolpyruvate carboxykinase (GTP)
VTRINKGVYVKVSATDGLTLAALSTWIEEIHTLTGARDVRICDGSKAEWDELTSELVDAGTLVRLEKKPNSFWCASDPTDVARVEDRTFICSLDKDDAGPTNNWMAPAEMKSIMTDLYRGSMKNRTMYVIPFCMGPINSKDPKFGVQITDSAYVVISMHIMTRMGTEVLAALQERGTFVKAMHSVGAPLEDGQKDVAWPCSDTKYISQFPEERLIWSYGSGYGGNALLGKKCYSLRIASVIGRDEGWLAEHMLILKVTTPANEVHFIAAAFPSACGKTNLAMLDSKLPGWKVETLGDDIAWMRFGEDGRLYAMNPENGFFGVAPGTGWTTNANAMRTVEKGNSIFTNVALTDDGDIWWEGMTDTPPAHLTDWKHREWTPENGELSSHANSRFCTPASQCPIIAKEWDDPAGVPISAIFFGGRRKTTIPLVVQSRDWEHGVFMGATLSSETTAAATGQVGVVRRDPFAMLPFIGYHVGDYIKHWLTMGKRTEASKLPKIFYVNWFRRGADGRFLWPGFGENMRVLKWAIEQVEGNTSSHETALGLVPAPGALDTAGISVSAEDVAEASLVNTAEWKEELPLIDTWFATIGKKLPEQMHKQLDLLKANVSK